MCGLSCSCDRSGLNQKPVLTRMVSSRSTGSLQKCFPSPRSKLPEDSKLVNIPAGRTLVVLLCCGVNRLIVRLSSSQVRKTASVSLTSLRWVSLLVFFWKNKWPKKERNVLLCLSWEVEDFAHLVTPVATKSYHHLGPSPMRPNELCGLAQTTEPPGEKPLVVRGVVVDPFEEEEEGIDIVCQRRD